MTPIEQAKGESVKKNSHEKRYLNGNQTEILHTFNLNESDDRSKRFYFIIHEMQWYIKDALTLN